MLHASILKCDAATPILRASDHEGQPGGAESYLKLSSPKAASRYAMMSIRTSRCSWTLKVHDEQSFMQLI